MPRSTPIGAYLQVFKNTGYPEFTLSHFRNFYPDSKIYMVSDCGYDFSSLASEKGCVYEHSPINVGVKPGGFSKAEILEWLWRLKRCFEYCDEEFVIYLEDDILTRGRIDVDAKSVISGFLGNRFPSSISEYFRSKYKTAKFNSGNYGACGGTVYHRKTFLDNFHSIVKIVDEDFDKVVYGISFLFAHFDCFMTVVYMAMGYGYDINKNLVGTVYTPSWRNTAHPVVHIQKTSNNDPIQRQIMSEFGS